MQHLPPTRCSLFQSATSCSLCLLCGYLPQPSFSFHPVSNVFRVTRFFPRPFVLCPHTYLNVTFPSASTTLSPFRFPCIYIHLPYPLNVVYFRPEYLRIITSHLFFPSPSSSSSATQTYYNCDATERGAIYVALFSCLRKSATQIARHSFVV